MSHEPDERTFLKECVAAREYIFKQMIDMCLEQGKPFRAMAWKWICDNRKWPSKRKKTEKVSRWSNRTIVCYKYGWSFRPAVESFAQSEEIGSGPNLPYVLVQYYYISANDLSETEDGALWQAAHAVANWFEKEDRRAKRMAEIKEESTSA